MKKKNVLLVHNFYQIGGGEHTVFENEKNLLLENGHKVYTYTRSNNELKESKWRILMLPLTTIWSFKTYWETRKLIKKHDIQIVHCHNTFPLISPSVYYAARSLKIPVVQTIHNFRFLCPNGLFYCKDSVCEKCREMDSFVPALKNGCYRNSRLQTAVVVAMLKIHRWLGTYRKINYIFLTEFNKNKFCDLIDIHGDNIYVKPNFVNSAETQRQDREVQPVFVFAGRLDKNKGIDFLLDVWPELPQEYELHIYGDGSYREACEFAAKEHSNISYLGFCSKTDILKDLSYDAALLFPSDLYEGYPMILIESFSIAKPVVATDLGNHGDIILTSGGGVTFTCKNKRAFKEAIHEVLIHNQEYAFCAGKYYQEMLTEQKNYEKLKEIYDKAKHIS